MEYKLPVRLENIKGDFRAWYTFTCFRCKKESEHKMTKEERLNLLPMGVWVDEGKTDSGYVSTSSTLTQGMDTILNSSYCFKCTNAIERLTE